MKNTRKSPLYVIGTIVLAVVVVLLRQYGPASSPPSASTPAVPNAQTSTQPATRSSGNDDAILRAFRAKQSNLIVQSSGVVQKLLPDDRDGDQHQRLIVRLSSGHTILIAHNIDLAPRVPAKEGDTIEFRGEYEFTEEGGTIHWTHHDPARRHDDGWIKLAGKKYE